MQNARLNEPQVAKTAREISTTSGMQNISLNGRKRRGLKEPLMTVKEESEKLA